MINDKHVGKSFLGKEVWLITSHYTLYIVRCTLFSMNNNLQFIMYNVQ
jgi:hypothetical protein